MENNIKNVSAAMCTIDNIKTIKQSKYYYCAAACLKMCLNDAQSQDEIFSNLKARTIDQENWYAEPDAVYSYLREHVDCLRVSEKCDSSLEATEWILSCIASTNMSAPMLVSAGKHWVLYSGYQLDGSGSPTGIYIRDPWPTTATITFYPFCTHFFEEYFCNINVEGPMKGKPESFVSSQTLPCIKITPIKKPLNGGMLPDNDLTFFVNDILKEDLSSYGFTNFGKLKNGGIHFDDCIIQNSIDFTPKYLLTYMEINNSLSIAAIEIESQSVIAIMTATDQHYSLYNKERIAKLIRQIYHTNVTADDIIFIYDEKKSTSCFEPIIQIRNIGSFNLLLEKL